MECAGKEEKNIIRLLVALDQNYLPQLQVLLTSIAVNNPDENVEVYLMPQRYSSGRIGKGGQTLPRSRIRTDSVKGRSRLF